MHTAELHTGYTLAISLHSSDPVKPVAPQTTIEKGLLLGFTGAGGGASADSFAFAAAFLGMPPSKTTSSLSRQYMGRRGLGLVSGTLFASSDRTSASRADHRTPLAAQDAVCCRMPALRREQFAAAYGTAAAVP